VPVGLGNRDHSDDQALLRIVPAKIRCKQTKREMESRFQSFKVSKFQGFKGSHPISLAAQKSGDDRETLLLIPGPASNFPSGTEGGHDERRS
jgi:hypothetical protein